MIKRDAAKTLLILAKQFKAVAIIGPRQSGKTTLAKMCFPNKKYISLENLTNRNFALEDPEGFIYSIKGGAIIDEIQRAPDLFSYLQQPLDETSETGKFIFTGSNNFLLQEAITQSLAGRIAYLTLLPFSINELNTNNSEIILKGFYPPIHDQPVDSNYWLESYIQTYVERDVRQLKQISNLVTFNRFIKLCSGRVGQLLNKNSLAMETGIDNKTVSSWLNLLETSFIVYRLHPHHKNFNKRLVKMPKLYFYDTGLLCSLLGITTFEQLIYHPFKGAIFENFVINEFIKQKNNFKTSDNFYFWRDNVGYEIDLLIENGLKIYPVEIKSGKSINQDYFKNINFWKKISGQKKATIIYDGKNRQKRSDGTDVIHWSDFFAKIKLLNTD